MNMDKKVGYYLIGSGSATIAIINIAPNPEVVSILVGYVSGAVIAMGLMLCWGFNLIAKLVAKSIKEEDA